MKRFWLVLLVVVAAGLALGPSSSQAQVCPDPPTDDEEDCFEDTKALVHISSSQGWTESIILRGPTTVQVDLGSLLDAAPANGLDEVDTEIVSMELTGTSSHLGVIIVRVPQSKHPGQKSLGKIEENENAESGWLDLPGRADEFGVPIPPFCLDDPVPDDCEGTSATSWFDVYFEVVALGQTLHNHTPKHMEATITHRPPAEAESYFSPDLIPLYWDATGTLEGPGGIHMYVGSVRHTPRPGPIGGTSELVVGEPASSVGPASGSGSPVPYAALAGGAAAALVAVLAGGWYARRRWLR